MFILRRIDNNPIQVRPLVVKAIIQPPYGDSVMSPLFERHLQRSREDDALVSVALVQSLYVLGVTVDDDAADSAESPVAADAVGAASSYWG